MNKNVLPCVSGWWWSVTHCFHSLFYACVFQAHLHHYLHVEGLEQSTFTEAVSSLGSLITEYQQLDTTKHQVVPNTPRLSIAT